MTAGFASNSYLIERDSNPRHDTPSSDKRSQHVKPPVLALAPPPPYQTRLITIGYLLIATASLTSLVWSSDHISKLDIEVSNIETSIF